MKRQRSDSSTAAVAAAQSAVYSPIDPPAHIRLREGDRPFWDAVLCARARYSWTDVDLAHAANLARCHADIERLQAELATEGDVLSNDRGTRIVNPKHALLETLSRRAVALSRMLHVHAEATVGESRDQPKSLALEKSARNAAKATAAKGDDLIPRLHAVQ